MCSGRALERPVAVVTDMIRGIDQGERGVTSK